MHSWRQEFAEFRRLHKNPKRMLDITYSAAYRHSRVAPISDLRLRIEKETAEWRKQNFIFEAN